MNKNNTGLAQVGKVLTIAVVAAGLVGMLSAFAADTSNTPQSKVTVGNATPSVSNLKLNNNGTITLTPNATTSVLISYTISDNNGCDDIVTYQGTSTAFRNGVQSTCVTGNPTVNNLNCYKFILADRVTSTCSGTSINVTDTVDIYYFADSANQSSGTYPNDHWEAYATALDGSASSSAAVTTTAVTMNSLIGLTVTTSTINYGAMSANSTSTSDSMATSTNVGNSTSSLSIYATQTLQIDATHSLVTSSQHYATSTFQWGLNERALTDTVGTQVFAVKLITPTSTGQGASSSKATFWRLQVAGGSATGTYTGTTVFASGWSL